VIFDGILSILFPAYNFGGQHFSKLKISQFISIHLFHTLNMLIIICVKVIVSIVFQCIFYLLNSFPSPFKKKKVSSQYFLTIFTKMSWRPEYFVACNTSKERTDRKGIVLA